MKFKRGEMVRVKCGLNHYFPVGSMVKVIQETNINQDYDLLDCVGTVVLDGEKTDNISQVVRTNQVERCNNEN